MRDLTNYLLRVNQLNCYVKTVKNFYNMKLNETPYSNYLNDNVIPKNSGYTFDTFLVILKSNALMMMYSLVEATVKATIRYIYESINIGQIPIEKLSDKYLHIWYEYRFRNSDGDEFNAAQQKEIAESLVTDVINGAVSANFAYEKLKLSGNADIKSIKKIYIKHDIKISNEMANKSASKLRAVKDSRNDLAHGGTSFVAPGKDLSIGDVEDYAKSVVEFLDYLNKISSDFVSKERFKSSSR